MLHGSSVLYLTALKAGTISETQVGLDHCWIRFPGVTAMERSSASVYISARFPRALGNLLSVGQEWFQEAAACAAHPNPEAFVWSEALQMCNVVHYLTKVVDTSHICCVSVSHSSHESVSDLSPLIGVRLLID